MIGRTLICLLSVLLPCLCQTAVLSAQEPEVSHEIPIDIGEDPNMAPPKNAKTHIEGSVPLFPKNTPSNIWDNSSLPSEPEEASPPSVLK